MNKSKKRYLLKISGEVLSGEGGKGFDKEALSYIAGEIKQAVEASDCELAIVLGGGNIIRGSRLVREIETTPVISDQAGMLGTIINGLILQDYLEHNGLNVRVASAVEVNSFVEPYLRRRVMNHLAKGRIVVLAGGTGGPRFTTDTGAVLRAVEIGADEVLKGTKVDGIYSEDPKSNPDAEFIGELDYLEYIDKGLRILDTTAVTLAGENSMNIRVFDIFAPGNLTKVLSGESLGSLITPGK